MGGDLMADTVVAARVGGCQPWCAIHHVPWFAAVSASGVESEQGKCSWTENCGGCGECYGDDSDTCMSWCGDHPSPFEEKCTWMKACAGCSECNSDDSTGRKGRRSEENAKTTNVVSASAPSAVDAFGVQGIVLFAAAVVVGAVSGSLASTKRLTVRHAHLAEAQAGVDAPI